MTCPAPTFGAAHRKVTGGRWIRLHGRVRELVGVLVESAGPVARMGELCIIETGGERIPAEVVGFRGDNVMLMPLTELAGISAGCVVRGQEKDLRAPVGEQVCGRIVDALGFPIDGREPLSMEGAYPLAAAPPNALSRRLIETPFPTGVKAIDGMLTIGEGQRMGIFAGSGVGKSTLLGMIARYGKADVNVIALVGERGREVREFIENDLGADGLARSVVVCATSDQPALLRIKAAFTATAMAEYFRDQGLRVMLMMDSVTRFCMAQREVGLATGEPPSTKGYTPSVFALLPKLMERSGNSDRGSITALYTVLVEGDDQNEPIADACRSILDGHIVLNRKLVSKGHYPPIDVRQSLSRSMDQVATKDQIGAARRIRELIAAREDVDDLVSIGAYQAGTNPLADQAIQAWPHIERFLRQDKSEPSDWNGTLGMMKEIAA